MVKRAALLASAAGFLTALLCPLVASAECPATPDLELMTMNSEIVVYGEVTALEALEGERWRVEIEVKRAYKGKYDSSDTVEVYTHGHEDIDFHLKQSVMAYASKGAQGKLETPQCLNPRAMNEAPISAESPTFFAVPPADAPLEYKTRRASTIFVGEVMAAGTGFAGRWEGVMLEVKVREAYKGITRNATVKVRLDEDSCGAGMKRDLLSDEASGSRDAKPPYEVKQSYLFYTFDEAPYQVLLCHDNMQLATQAQPDIALIKTMCRKGRCESGHDKMGALRLAVKQSMERRTLKSLQTCADELPLFSDAGSLTELELNVRLRPDGLTELLNISSRGTIETGSVYNALGTCMDAQVKQWDFEPMEGRPDLEAALSMELKKSTRGPKVESTSIIVSAR